MSQPLVTIPSNYTSDVPIEVIQSHLSTLYYYGTKCNSVREVGPSGMLSSAALVYGVLHQSLPDVPIPDISITTLETLFNESNNLFGLGTKYPDLDYKWIHTIKPAAKDQSDLIHIPIWHLTDDGLNLFENSKSGTVNLSARISEYSEYAKKYLIIHEQNVLNVMNKITPPNGDEIIQEGTMDIKCIDPMLDHAKRLNIPVETIRSNIWNTIQSFLATHPTWSVAKHDQSGSWVTVLEKTP
jgi:hypothetical protein